MGDIQYAIKAGVIKMNIDTDTQCVLGWYSGVRGEAPRLSPGPDREPRRGGEAEQEVLRPSYVPPQRRGGHGCASGEGHGGPELHQRPLIPLQKKGWLRALIWVNHELS